ncbi:hypothetical protein [Microbacterium sp. GXF0217]
MPAFPSHALRVPESSEAGASAVVPMREIPQVSRQSPAPQADSAPQAEPAPAAEDPNIETVDAHPQRRPARLRPGSA